MTSAEAAEKAGRTIDGHEAAERAAETLTQEEAARRASVLVRI